MIRMLIVPAALMLALSIAGCQSNSLASGGGGNGQSERVAPAYLPLHEVVLVGHIWHVEVDTGSGTATEQWQVVDKIGRSEFIVEHLNAKGDVTAYQVDSWAEAGKPNVRKAWVGKPGEAPKEITVATEMPKADEPGFILRGKFNGVEMAGKKFNGEVVTVRDGGVSTKTWIADEGWFDRVIRKDVNDKTVAKVTLIRTNIRVQPLLSWTR
jgi:hypothetical protein